MLNAVNTRIFFLGLLLLTIFFDWTYDFQFWVYILLLLAYLSILVYGSCFIQSDYFSRSLWQGSSERKAIAITFDDGPIKDFTPKVLDILKEQKAPASFFMIGKNIKGNDEIVKRIDSEGHLIGNHS